VRLRRSSITCLTKIEELKAEGVRREKLEEVCRSVRNELSSYLVVSITNPYQISQ